MGGFSIAPAASKDATKNPIDEKESTQDILSGEARDQNVQGFEDSS